MRTTMTLHESQDGGRFLAARNGMDAAWRHHEYSSRYMRYRLCAQCDLIELCTVQLPNVRRCMSLPPLAAARPSRVALPGECLYYPAPAYV